MVEPSTPPKKFQWKWVGISFVSYALFYVVPLIVAGAAHPKGLSNFAGVFLSVWALGGIIVIAAVVAYISEAVTLWEPAVGAGLLVTLALLVLALHIIVTERGHRISDFRLIVPIVVLTAIAFVLSLLGAWFGERAQKLWKGKAHEQA